MSKSQINLQDAFLNHVRKEKIPVVINLSGGGSVAGLVKGFDNFVILVKHEGQHLIYKHAINSIVPERPVELAAGGPGPRATESKPEVQPEVQSESRPEEKPARDASDLGAETTAKPPEENEEPWVEG